MKILFQGDSITDAGRDRSDAHELGNGYPKYAAENLRLAFPNTDFEFINLGISGNETKDLVERLQTDFIDVQPDIVSIMIGVNDTWHYCEGRKWISNEVFESNYRTVLQALRDKTDALIMMLEPYLLPFPEKEFFREDLAPKIQIERRLAREFADIYVPTDGLLASALVADKNAVFSEDGVHPNENGAKFIGGIYAGYMAGLIDKKVKGSLL